MDSTNIIIPFDFPFAILENRNNTDPNKKLVYAVADGQFTYGPLSLYQYHNDEKYSKTIREEGLPRALPCKEFYIIESGCAIDNAIEIIDNKRGRIYVKEIEHEPEQICMKELIQVMTECKNEIQSLKSIVLSEDRIGRGSLNASYATPSRNTKQINQSVTGITKRNVSTTPRSQSVTTTRALLKNVKSSGYGQQSPGYSLRK